MRNGNNTSVSDSARIVRVGALARDALDINFDNESILILNIDLILSLPGFDVLAEDDRIYYPKTDGKSVYWREGPRALSVEEILALTGKTAVRREEIGKGD